MCIPKAPHKCFIFGLGYTGQYLAKILLDSGWIVGGTSQTEEGMHKLELMGVEAHIYTPHHGLYHPVEALAGVTHLLISVPPDDQGDPVLRDYLYALECLPELVWLGYLSSTGVYGDHGGRWVYEDGEVSPPRPRAAWRLLAERQWQQAAEKFGLPLHIFRLAGIYGPGRSVIERLESGHAQHVHKEGHVMSRVHVEDIVHCLMASMAAPTPGEIYNVADDEPASTADVVAYAAELLGKEIPPLISPEEADLSEDAKSYYAVNRRISNKKIKDRLNISLQHPTYREGLQAIISGM